MAATQTKGFELFTKTFQEQYSIDASILRSVAWDVWKNELSEADRKVWERMAAPQQVPPSDDATGENPFAESRPAQDAKAEIIAAHKPGDKDEGKSVQKKSPEPGPEPKPASTPQQSSSKTAQAATSDAKQPASSKPESAPQSAPQSSPQSSLQTGARPSPKPDHQPEVEAEKPGQRLPEEDKPAPPAPPPVENSSRHKLELETEATLSPEGPDHNTPAEETPPPAARQQQTAAPEQTPPARPSAPLLSARDDASQKPSAAQRLGGMFASLKRLRDKPGTKQTKTSLPTSFPAATQPEPERPAALKEPAVPAAEASDSAPEQKPPEQKTPEQKKSDQTAPAGIAPPLSSPAASSPAASPPAAPPPLESDEAEPDDLSDDWQPEDDDSFFLESDTIPPPAAGDAHSAGPGADILRDVLTHRPDEDVGIAESVLISRKNRKKPQPSDQPPPEGAEAQEKHEPDRQPDDHWTKQNETAQARPAAARQPPEEKESLGETGLYLDQVLLEEDTGPASFLDKLDDSLGDKSGDKLGEIAQSERKPAAPNKRVAQDEAAAAHDERSGYSTEPMEIEPIEEDDPESFVVDESAAFIGPMPDRSAAERVVARFRAAAEVEDDLSDPEFLVEESDVLQERSRRARARHAASERLAEHAESLVNALVQRSLQGDAMALGLCIRHVLPQKMLRSVAQALGERALQLGTQSHPGLLALLAGKQAGPTASDEQVREMVDRLSRQALEGDLAAMEVCLRLCPVPPQLHQATAPLTEKLLHRALEGDALLLALFLEHLGPVQLADEDTRLLEKSLLTYCEEGDDSALKACLASLFED